MFGAAVATSGMHRPFYVYILASDSRELYVGVTNNLVRRLIEHREGSDPYRYVFRHATTRLVHVEAAGEARDAIRRREATERLDAA